MIIGSIKEADRYFLLGERIAAALRWLQTAPVSTLEEGKHTIDGDALFCNVCAYTTALEQDRVWEGHQHYLDIHFMIEGSEYIDVSPSSSMQVKQDYDPKTDFTEFSGTPQQHVLLEKGTYLIVFPEDIHRTALRIDPKEGCPVRKGIIKVLL